uniref:C-type lectin domain-containing protein n=1 Tax=Astatotilapia calliptera TaxID=8154 RepID=A0A3P8QRW2_ASTCA
MCFLFLIFLEFALIRTMGTLRNLELKLETVKKTKPSPIVNSSLLQSLKDEPFLRCEEGWEQHRETCYYLSTRKLSWSKSRDDCRAERGDLVKIDSMEEQV